MRSLTIALSATALAAALLAAAPTAARACGGADHVIPQVQGTDARPEHCFGWPYRCRQSTGRRIASCTVAIRIATGMRPGTLPTKGCGRGTCNWALYGLYLQRAKDYAKIRQYGRAIADYSAEIKAVPNNWLAHFWRGQAYRAVGLREQAIADYRRMLAIQPGLSDRAAWKRLAPHARAALKKLGVS